MYVISYDIVSDRLRNSIDKTLKGYGNRVQYSVFECKLSEKQYEKLYVKLKELMKNSKEDTIRIYRICKNCEDNLTILGTEKIERWEEKDVIVL